MANMVSRTFRSFRAKPALACGRMLRWLGMTWFAACRDRNFDKKKIKTRSVPCIQVFALSVGYQVTSRWLSREERQAFVILRNAGPIRVPGTVRQVDPHSKVMRRQPKRRWRGVCPRFGKHYPGFFFNCRFKSSSCCSSFGRDSRMVSHATSRLISK